MIIKEVFKKITPKILIDWYHLLLSFVGAIVYRFPSSSTKVIGVTGTNGKTTVVNLAVKILEQAGYKVASISSIKFKIGQQEKRNLLKMTMPGRFKLQKFLRRAVSENCDYVIIEVTSEGIKQHRHRFISFNAAVFTNLTPEHIESHGSFESYKREKGKLFKALERNRQRSVSIVNLDDENSDYFLNFSAKKKISYGVNNEKASLNATNIEIFPNKLKFTVDETKIVLNLNGLFNIHNALAAISIGLSQGETIEVCKKALEKIDIISGRMEKVISKPFEVIVDYAHTPDALRKVYSSIPKESRKICVLGSCGGGRDKWKRPLFGEIAAEFCDDIILTNEDPYNEDPKRIINQIESGVKKHGKDVIKILDRRKAIKKALKLAKKNDVIIITGKGSEPWMCVKDGIKIPWDDRKIVKEELRRLNL